MPSLDELLPLELAPQTPMALLALLRQPALWTPPDSEAVAEARSHRIDALLGLRPVEREAARPAARRGVPTALGEASHSRPWGSAATVALLSTPYATLEAVFQELAVPAGARVIDLGAGYGRVGFYLALRQPALSFYGLEIVAARVDEARRVASVLGLAALHFAEQDLADAALRLPEGDVYFMYQPVNDETQPGDERLLLSTPPRASGSSVRLFRRRWPGAGRATWGDRVERRRGSSRSVLVMSASVIGGAVNSGIGSS